MNNQDCCSEHFILLLSYIPVKGEFIFPRLLLDLFKKKKTHLTQLKCSGAL